MRENRYGQWQGWMINLKERVLLLSERVFEKWNKWSCKESIRESRPRDKILYKFIFRLSIIYIDVLRFLEIFMFCAKHTVATGKNAETKKKNDDNN